jgi:pimeloyl-ACP methyl ester carboxylesterase
MVGVAAAVVAGLGAGTELAPASVRHRLGLTGSPDHRVRRGSERTVSGAFMSSRMRGKVGWSIAVPTASVTGIVYCLHGRGESHTMAFSELHIPDMVNAAGLGLVVAACDGGEHSYWHPRADGTNPMGMFFDEFIPMVERHVGAIQRRALMGWSMGGYGALLFASERPDLFRAVAAGSAALWTTPRATAPGAFDSASDYERWNVFDRTERLAGLTVRVDCGSHDPFLAADRTFANRLPPPRLGTFTSGFHDAAYWRSIAPAQIATINTALHD